MSLFVMRPASTTQNTPPLTSATHNVSVIGNPVVSVTQQQLVMTVSNQSMSYFPTSSLSVINNGNDNNNKTTTLPPSSEKKGMQYYPFCLNIKQNRQKKKKKQQQSCLKNEQLKRILDGLCMGNRSRQNSILLLLKRNTILTKNGNRNNHCHLG